MTLQKIKENVISHNMTTLNGIKQAYTVFELLVMGCSTLQVQLVPGELLSKFTISGNPHGADYVVKMLKCISLQIMHCGKLF